MAVKMVNVDGGIGGDGMREENFLAFWLVFGFFIGLLVGFLNWSDPFDILTVVAMTTLCFYLMAHLSVAFFIRFMEFGKVPFEKEAYDKKLDYFYNQLLQREREIDTYRDFSELSAQEVREKQKGDAG